MTPPINRTNPSTHEPPGPNRSKVLSREQLLALRRQAKAEGRSIVHCHGCFDIVHPGHIRHLQDAARQGELLLVSITADTHIAKGTGRPLFNQSLRAENLAALSCVDWVYICPDATAESLLDEVRPDIYIKGREYERNNDPRFAAERDAVERHGGRVVFSSGDVVFSSSALIEAIHAHQSVDDEWGEDPARTRLRQLQSFHDLSPGAIDPLLAQMAGKRIVVFGETIIDTYIACTWPDVAGESPMLTLRPIEETSFDGGAAIIARHAASLGAHATLVTAIPDTAPARELMHRLGDAGVEVVPIPCDTPIPEKQRYLVGREKVVKIDRVTPIAIDARARRLLVDAGVRIAEGADGAIIADFGLGMFSPRTIEDLCATVRPRVRVLAGDVSGRRSSLMSMRSADWLTPTEAELRRAINDYDSSLPAVAWQVMERTSARDLVVTLGADGLILFRRALDASAEDPWPSRVVSEHIPALSANPVDALGSGDAFLASSALALACGAEPLLAAYIGALGAAVEGAMLGNIPIEPSRISAAARRIHDDHPVIRAAPRVRMVS